MNQEHYFVIERVSEWDEIVPFFMRRMKQSSNESAASKPKKLWLHLCVQIFESASRLGIHNYAPLIFYQMSW